MFFYNFVKDILWCFKRAYIFFISHNDKFPSYEPDVSSNNEKAVCIILDKGLGDFILFSYYLRRIVDYYEKKLYKVSIISNEYNVKFLEVYYPNYVSKAIIIKNDSFECIDSKLLIDYRYKFAVAICPTFYSTLEQCRILRILSPSVIYSVGKGGFSLFDSFTTLDNKLIESIRVFDISKRFYCYMHKEFLERLLKIPLELKVKNIRSNYREIDDEYFVINISGNNRSKLLSNNQFFELAEKLSKKVSLKAVIIGNIEVISNEYINNKNIECTYLSNIDLDKTISICQYARFVVSGDTGIFHLSLSIDSDNIVIVPTSGKNDEMFMGYPEKLCKNRFKYFKFQECDKCRFNKITCFLNMHRNCQTPCVHNANIDNLVDYIDEVVYKNGLIC